MITIAIANHKGGVGKTTTAYWLGRCLAEMGHSVTLVDLDPQANLTAAAGDSAEQGIVEVLRLQSPVRRTIVQCLLPPAARGNLAIVPSRTELADVADDLTVKQLGILRLRSALEQYAADIDEGEIVLIDCPPNVGALTFSALIAADFVIIPTQPAAWSIAGVERIEAKCVEVGEALGRRPALLGTVATLVDGRVNGHHDHLARLTNCERPPLLGAIPRREGKNAIEALHDAYWPVAEAIVARLEYDYALI